MGCCSQWCRPACVGKLASVALPAALRDEDPGVHPAHHAQGDPEELLLVLLCPVEVDYLHDRDLDLVTMSYLTFAFPRPIAFAANW